jgi:hypothetical protein
MLKLCDARVVARHSSLALFLLLRQGARVSHSPQVVQLVRVDDRSDDPHAAVLHVEREREDNPTTYITEDCTRLRVDAVGLDCQAELVDLTAHPTSKRPTRSSPVIGSVHCGAFPPPSPYTTTLARAATACRGGRRGEVR